jgi:hypothetical protein
MTLAADPTDATAASSGAWSGPVVRRSRRRPVVIVSRSRGRTWAAPRRDWPVRSVPRTHATGAPRVAEPGDFGSTGSTPGW